MFKEMLILKLYDKVSIFYFFKKKKMVDYV